MKLAKYGLEASTKKDNGIKQNLVDASHVHIQEYRIAQFIDGGKY